MNKMMRRVLRACYLYDSVVDFKHWLMGAESQYTKFYSQFVRPGDLCFDVGANVGRRTSVLIQLKANVVAVEPQESCMRRLRRRFKGNGSVVLVQGAVGERPGRAEMRLCDSHSLSSLSTDWIHRVQASGRYAQCTWRNSVVVEVTTLDELIARYGKPAFVKLDVEGYEYQALRGLCQSVKCVCFEFTPEVIDSTGKCVEYLSKLGEVRFNYCLENAPTCFKLGDWKTASEMEALLGSLSSQRFPGDIYARFDM